MSTNFVRRPRTLRSGRTAAFTLLELIVSLAIVAMLAALLLMAVQRTREASRQVTCMSSLRQLAVASDIYLTRHGHFVSNGWGYNWGPEADRGLGPKQPAGWIYQLAFEFDAAAAESFADPASGEQRHPYLSLVRCPTRSAPTFGPVTSGVSPVNYDQQPTVPKTDYAINEGDYYTRTRGGPEGLADEFVSGYDWSRGAKATGISYQRSRVRPAAVCDGLSHTYLIGEKHVSRDWYHTAEDRGYNSSCWSGIDRDLNRWTAGAPIPDTWRGGGSRFGSAHPGIWHIAFCDGSVRKFTFEMNGKIHQMNGHCCDRGSVQDDPFGG